MVLLNLCYAYDGNGNCTEKSGEPYQNTYTYDRMNRLTGSIQDGKGVRYTYDLAGNRLKKATRQETGDVPNRLTCTGQMYDGVAGQYYLRARFYNPVVGRFLPEDTYRGDGLNLYAYCANNPVMYYDPSGYAQLWLGGKTNPGAEETPDGFEKINSTKNLEATEIILEYVEGMDKNQFYRKVNELMELGEKGLWYKAENPVQRNPLVTRNYRQDIIQRIWWQYGTANPDFANALINRVTSRMQPDHIWELQLGGPDTASIWNKI